MASCPAPLASSKETTNYARLCRLLVDVGTQVLRDTFDRIHPPATLHKILSAAHPTLQCLKKKVLNPTQWGMLYPTHPSSVSSASFDITLLMILLRNICSLTPPASTGSWDKLPSLYDNSTEANIARIKYYRNNVYAHASHASVDDAQFNVLWQDISKALLALGSVTKYTGAINRLKTECMDPDVEEHYRQLLKQWEIDDNNTKEKLEHLEETLKSEVGEVKEILTQCKREEGDTKDKLGEIEETLKSEVGEVKEMLSQCKREEGGTKDKLGEIEDMLRRLETDEGSSKDTLKEIQEMLKQWMPSEDSANGKLSETEDSFGPADFIDDIRQLYKKREGWLAPFPWCEEFRFHLDNIFTRLKMVSRMKERGTKTDSTVNILEIFKPHNECSQPRKILIEGQPGMGKTTYCNKVAYDWAKNCKAEDSFPDFQVVLLLKCRDINSDLWEAIDDQLLPRDMKKEEKEKFFTFVRDHQSKVLLVLDGLDELPTHKLPIYKEIIQGRMLPKCYLVVTARPKAGIKVRECCDTLLEVEGFTKHDAESYIRRYFKTEEHLAETLLGKLRTDASLEGLTANPLNAALLCLLCEDFQGDLPKGRTLLYFEIVQCVLKRYRRKKGLSETDEDLTQLYHTELKHLGRLAMNGLLNDEMYFDHSAFGNSGSDLIPALGFLSVQPGRSKRRPSLCYGFLHKSFQEFFAAFYLSCQLVDEEISPDSFVADTRYFDEFEQVRLFTCGILARRCETKALALIASMASKINQSVEEGKSSMYLRVAVSCIEECEKDDRGTFGKELARSLGAHLEIQKCDCRWLKSDSEVAVLGDTLEANSTVTELFLSKTKISDSDAASLAKLMEANSTLTEMYLPDSNISYLHAAKLAKAMQVNSTLTLLSLSENDIGDLGAAAMAEAMEVNSTLTHLGLSDNEIGDSGAAAMAKAMEVNSTLTHLELSDNNISDSGAAAMAKAMEVNSTLTHLGLSDNGISDSGAAAMAKVMEVNSTLTYLNLSSNCIGDSGAIALAETMRINSTLTKLDLGSEIVDSRSAAKEEQIDLYSRFWVMFCGSAVGDSGAVALAKAMETNRTLTYFALSGSKIGDTGVLALAKAVESNSTLTELDLSRTYIRGPGAAALAEAMKRNSTLTRLDLHHSEIGDSGAAALAKAMELNSTLTRLNLHRCKIGDSGAAAMATAMETNSTLKWLDLSVNNIGDSGAAALAEAMEPNSTLTWLDLSYNKISDSVAVALAEAMEQNSTRTWLNLSDNRCGSIPFIIRR